MRVPGGVAGGQLVSGCYGWGASWEVWPGGAAGHLGSAVCWLWAMVVGCQGFGCNERKSGFRLRLLLPRVINVKFPLQPHQKYNITQYEELDFS